MALKPSQNGQPISNCKDEEDSQMECDEAEILPFPGATVPCIKKAKGWVVVQNCDKFATAMLTTP